MADIVEDFLNRLAQHAPGIPPETRVRLEQDVRQQWGGSEVYVGKRLSIVTRTTMVSLGLRQQRPIREVFAQAGIARATGYRILGRR